MAAEEPSGIPPVREANGSAPGSPAWWIYQGTGRPLPEGELALRLPPPPPWREFDGGPVLPLPPGDDRDLRRRLGPVANARIPHEREVDAVNAALVLRRPLLVTGRPGVGKSSLAYQVARELRLGRVLRWPVSSRSTLRDGLHSYDAISRAQDAAAARHAPDGGLPPEEAGIGRYLRLGPLGTALLPYDLPRVLLIDELDKSDIDLPNDLLDVLEEGEYSVPELERVSAREPVVRVHTADLEGRADLFRGRVRCRAFPLVIITSNGEREFPSAFLRRCLQFTMTEPDEARLAGLVAAHFSDRADAHTRQLIQDFLEHRENRGGLAADQLLNAVYLATSARGGPVDDWERLIAVVWRGLNLEAAE